MVRGNDNAKLGIEFEGGDSVVVNYQDYHQVARNYGTNVHGPGPGRIDQRGHSAGAGYFGDRGCEAVGCCARDFVEADSRIVRYFCRYGQAAGGMARRPGAWPERGELAENSGRLRSLAGDATAGAESRQSTIGCILTEFTRVESTEYSWLKSTPNSVAGKPPLPTTKGRLQAALFLFGCVAIRRGASFKKARERLGRPKGGAKPEDRRKPI